MSVARMFSRLVGRFAGDRSGTVAVVFGIALIPMIMAAGAALDYMRAYTAQSRLQHALDSAALAAASARGLTDSERIELAVAAFNANYPAEKLGVPAAPDIRIGDGTVVARARAELPTTLMNIVGIDTLSVGSNSEVTLPGVKDAEIALVLDYSESMNQRGKYQAMRDAAIKLVDTLSQQRRDETVKFGLVPFSHHVYVRLPSDYVVGEDPGGVWEGCTQDRRWPYNVTDETPDWRNDDTRWGHPQAEVHEDYDCDGTRRYAGYVANNLFVRPLSDDYRAITRQLARMRPYSWTHIALGFEFGWHLLSPNAPFTEGVSYGDKKVQKALVLLTDGAQTEPAFGSDGRRTVRNGERNLETMCEAAKDKGILVITIAFDLDYSDPAQRRTRDRLAACASDDQYFYDASENDELATAFETITGQLAKAIYLSK